MSTHLLMNFFLTSDFIFLFCSFVCLANTSEVVFASFLCWNLDPESTQKAPKIFMRCFISSLLFFFFVPFSFSSFDPFFFPPSYLRFFLPSILSSFVSSFLCSFCPPLPPLFLST